jgi:hypothetical protein
MTREDVLAAEFERLAERLRDENATVYGYDVQADPPVERGGIAYDDRWLTFELEREPGEPHDGTGE